MTYRYIGQCRPSVPGIPAHDLTDEEYQTYAAEYGPGALRGVYIHDKPAPKSKKAEKPEGEED